MKKAKLGDNPNGKPEREHSGPPASHTSNAGANYLRPHQASLETPEAALMETETSGPTSRIQTCEGSVSEEPSEWLQVLPAVQLSAGKAVWSGSQTLLRICFHFAVLEN